MQSYFFHSPKANNITFIRSGPFETTVKNTVRGTGWALCKSDLTCSPPYTPTIVQAAVPMSKGLRTKKEIPVCTFFLTTCADGYFCENFCVNGKEVFLSDRWFLFDTREKVFIAKPMKQTFPLSFGFGIISREMTQKQGSNTEIH